MPFANADAADQSQARKEIDGINDAVRHNDMGALQKMLAEVNEHNFSEASRASAHAIFGFLSPEAQKAVTALNSAPKINTIGPNYLDVSDLWRDKAYLPESAYRYKTHL